MNLSAAKKRAALKSRFAKEKEAREKAAIKKQQVIEDMIKARNAEPYLVDY